MSTSPNATLSAENNQADPKSADWTFTSPGGITGSGTGPWNTNHKLASDCYGTPSVKLTVKPPGQMTWESVKDHTELEWDEVPCES